MIDVIAALAVELEHEPVPADQVVSGAPTTALAELGMIGEQAWGVWEMSPGAMSDTEVDELFVVVAGRASVLFVDRGTTVELAAGTVGRLEAGDRTIWTVTETLRKVWIA